MASEYDQIETIKQQIAGRIFNLMALLGARRIKPRYGHHLKLYTGKKFLSAQEKKTATMYIHNSQANTSGDNFRKANFVAIKNVKYDKDESVVLTEERELKRRKIGKEIVSVRNNEDKTIPLTKEISIELEESKSLTLGESYGFNQEIKVTGGVSGTDTNGGATALFEATVGFSQELSKEENKTKTKRETDTTTINYDVTPFTEVDINIYTQELTKEKVHIVKGAIDFEIELNFENWTSTEFVEGRARSHSHRRIKFANIAEFVRWIEGRDLNHPKMRNFLSKHPEANSLIHGIKHPKYRQARFSIVEKFVFEKGLSYEPIVEDLRD